MSKQNGGIIGPDNVPTGVFGAASGVWKLSDVTNYKRQGTWPVALTGHQVANSCRFNGNKYLVRNKTTATNVEDFTISVWVKRSIIADKSCIISSWGGDTNNTGSIFFTDGDKLTFEAQTGGSYSANGGVRKITTQVFRDVSAWSHLVFQKDDGVYKIYHNGTEITAFDTNTQSSGTNVFSKATGNTSVGLENLALGGHPLKGYMSEAVLIDGQALDPTSFGETDSATNNWIPKDVSGLTAGNNGFYLDFKDSSALGNDAFGGTDFTVNNLTSIDQSASTCTNNEATLNPLDGNLGDSLFTEGNLKFDTNTGSNKPWSRSTIGVSSGKWYFEAKLITAANNQAIGISDRPSPDHNSTELGAGAFDYSYQSANSGDKYNNGSQSSYGNTYGANDIVSCALDLDNLKVYFGKNGTFQNSGNPTNGTNPAFTITAPSLTNHGFYFFCLADLTGSNKSVWEANFGSPSFAISSGNTDSSGMGSFEYAVPSGYYSLCTRNLNLIG